MDCWAWGYQFCKKPWWRNSSYFPFSNEGNSARDPGFLISFSGYLGGNTTLTLAQKQLLLAAWPGGDYTWTRCHLCPACWSSLSHKSREKVMLCSIRCCFVIQACIYLDIQVHVGVTLDQDWWQGRAHLTDVMPVVSNGLSLGLILFQRNFVVSTSNPIQHTSVPFITGGGSYRLSGEAMLKNNNLKYP